MPELDELEILRRLTARGVDFVVIGGLAAIAHGATRVTEDLDITYATDDANLEALGEALLGLGAALRGAPPDVPFVPDARTLRQVEVLTLETAAGDLDLLARPSGAPAYTQLRAHSVRMNVGDVWVAIANVDDLIGMKRAAGRDKDLLDVAELEAVKRLRRGIPPDDAG